MRIGSKNLRYVAAGSLLAAAGVLAFVPFNMGGCAVSPQNLDYLQIAKGGKQFFDASTISEKDEEGIGQSVALRATNTWHVYPDQDLNRYVTLVGRTLGAVSPASHLKLYFAVLNTDDVNAFSGPRGYIFVTRGAIARMHDESELAGVLGHEIGHVVKHHGKDAVVQAGQKAGISTAAKGVFGDSDFFKLADAGGDAVITVGFSQPQEMEADKEGVKYVIAAGYDANGFLHFLQRIDDENKKNGTKTKDFPQHPGTGDRIKQIASQIDKAHAGGQGATLADRFHVYVKTQAALVTPGQSGAGNAE